MADKKLTGNEIIKVLECCSKRAIYEDCPVGCPMYQFDGDCFDLIQKDILEFINNLQAENEALIAGQETLQKALAKKNAEIERLEGNLKEAFCQIENDEETIQNGVVACDDCHKKYAEKIETAKTQAIKEFAKRLKEEAEMISYEMCSEYQETIDTINNLVKEMVGDAE